MQQPEQKKEFFLSVPTGKNFFQAGKNSCGVDNVPIAGYIKG